MRRALQQSAPPASPLSAGQQNSQRGSQFTTARRAPQRGRELDGNESRNWDCPCGYTNHRLNKECRSCHKPAPPTGLSVLSTLPSRSTQNHGIFNSNSASTSASGQTPGSTGRPELMPRYTTQIDKPTLNSRQNLEPATAPAQPRDVILTDRNSTTNGTQPRISHAIDFKPPEADASDLTQSWKHIRRRSVETTAPAAEVKAPVGDRPFMEPPKSTISGNGAEDSILELERLARLERTKNGRYIGLNANRRTPDFHIRSSSQNNTVASKEEPKAEPMPASEEAQNFDLKAFRKTIPRGSLLPRTEGSEPVRATRTRISPFNNSRGSWSRWEPSPVESRAAPAPRRVESQASNTSRPNQSTELKEVGTNSPTRRETNEQPFAFPRTERFSETEKGRWKSWSPPHIEEDSPRNLGSDEGHASAEDRYFPVSSDASFQRIPINPVAEQDSERLETREPGREKKKSKRKEDDSIDEFQMARRNFKPESSTYSRGMNRDRARKKQKKFESEFEEDEDERAAAKIERRLQRRKERAMQKRDAPPTPIYLPEFISVSNLAAVLRVRVEDFVSRMQALGFEETSNDHVLDAEVAGLIAAEFNFEPIIDHGVSEDLTARPPAEDKSLLPPRPPVVTIMGHVDHGKTTLLDWLRKSSVAASEYGGITQHIGAFSVQMPSGKTITFLDTPGHAAFLSMRQRGANVTDIVILVVAADDSVKPQTIEAIKHAQAAKVPMIVAVNKIDKEDSNVDRVKQDLARYGVEIEDYGGDTQVVCVSGKTGQGMEELEDAAVALADILDMRAEIDGPAEGWVLEATTKKAGRVATVLVRRGTLRSGDVIVAGTTWARVRSLKNEAGMQVPSAGPGTPVEIDGWREQPAAGDEVLQAVDEQQAKSVVDFRLEDLERSQMATDMTAVNEARRIEQEKREAQEKLKLEEEAKEAGEDTPTPAPTEEPPLQPGIKEIFFLIKGDVSGSVEAVLDSVSALGNSEVRPHILRSGVGPVSEFDIEHAAAAKGHIIAFNVPIEPAMRRMADQAGVRILEDNIIYRLVDDVKAKLSEMLPPLVTQRVLGEAEVAQVFEINVKGRVMLPVAGCRVRNGVVSRTAKVRVMRGKEVVYDGMPYTPIFSLSFCYSFTFLLVADNVALQ